MLDSVAAGAAGYLTKGCTREELRQAVITTYGGGSVISPTSPATSSSEFARAARGEASDVRPVLNAREHEILRLRGPRDDRQRDRARAATSRRARCRTT